jgi:hypothetical protein
MIVVAACDEDLKTAIGRAVGARVGDDDVVELMVSRWQWQTVIDDVERCGRIAATFARPSDYVTYQVKGRGRPRVAGSDDHALADRYLSAITATLAGLGVPPAVMAPWFVSRDLMVISLEIDEVFVQTPGAAAGTRLELAR